MTKTIIHALAVLSRGRNPDAGPWRALRSDTPASKSMPVVLEPREGTWDDRRAPALAGSS